MGSLLRAVRNVMMPRETVTEVPEHDGRETLYMTDGGSVTDG